MFRLSDLQMVTSLEQLATLPDGKTLINTINAYSYCMAQKDVSFSKALKDNVLIPDGMSIVWACKFLKAKSKPLRRIAGYDLFELEMDKLNSNALATSRKKVMFVGSSEKVLSMIKERARIDYPNLEVFVYSPPYKSIFNAEDNAKIINAINEVAPDLLWIGMTAPKQEKWAAEHWNELNVSYHVGSIGAVFDFYAGTVKRAPKVWQNCGLEWLYRLITNPKRLWRRYVFGNIKFIYYILKEKLLLQ